MKRTGEEVIENYYRLQIKEKICYNEPTKQKNCLKAIAHEEFMEEKL